MADHSALYERIKPALDATPPGHTVRIPEGGAADVQKITANVETYTKEGKYMRVLLSFQGLVVTVGAILLAVVVVLL